MVIECAKFEFEIEIPLSPSSTKTIEILSVASTVLPPDSCTSTSIVALFAEPLVAGTANSAVEVVEKACWRGVPLTLNLNSGFAAKFLAVAVSVIALPFEAVPL